jgi:dimethylamine/trimethylamine dehydrogenase
LHLIASFDGETATVADVHTGMRRPIACRSLVIVGVRKPRDELYRALMAREAELAGAGIASVTRVGDAFAPGAIVHAVHDGHRFAREFELAADGSTRRTDAPYARDFPL